MNTLWTIEELTALAELALRIGGCDSQNSGRIRSLPDLRTIRYYTTLGLLDPPAEMRGRKAFYGRRHLMQLVAIKRLQARGMALVDVQQSLAGADNRNLARWAALPADFWDRAPSQLPPEQKPLSPDALLAEPAGNGERRIASSSPIRAQFWAVQPSLPESEEATPLNKVVRHAPRTTVHLPIAPGVELVVDGIDPSQFNQKNLDRLSPLLANLAQALRELQDQTTETDSNHEVDS